MLLLKLHPHDCTLKPEVGSEWGRENIPHCNVGSVSRKHFVIKSADDASIEIIHTGKVSGLVFRHNQSDSQGEKQDSGMEFQITVHDRYQFMWGWDQVFLEVVVTPHTTTIPSCTSSISSSAAIIDEPLPPAIMVPVDISKFVDKHNYIMPDDTSTEVEEDINQPGGGGCDNDDEDDDSEDGEDDDDDHAASHEVRINTVCVGEIKTLIGEIFPKMVLNPSANNDPRFHGHLFLERPKAGKTPEAIKPSSKARKFRPVPLLEKMEKAKQKILDAMKAEHDRLNSEAKTYNDFVARRVQYLGEKGKDCSEIEAEVGADKKKRRVIIPKRDGTTPP